MDFYVATSLIGSGCSICTIFMPDKWKSKKLTLTICVFVLAVGSCVITNQNSKLVRINRVSIAAQELVSKRVMHFTDDGFIQACLAFLEQNKDIYPDAYHRAVSLYSKYKDSDSIFSAPTVHLASELEGIVLGISIIAN